MREHFKPSNEPREQPFFADQAMLSILTRSAAAIFL
jgi:hypothetical protein